ncbi:MAG: FN3 associated domain-containing protein [Desulfotomaculaceae bacterium]|nr:FN3 associated domain-containing protein [Desulfotomaculaceae bacterium]
MRAVKRKGATPVAEKRQAISVKKFLCLLLFAALLNITAPGVALAEQSDSIEITGDGVTTPVTLTLAQIQAMEQYQHVYSVINTWPTKKWYVAEGIKLRDLFALAGIKEDAMLVKFMSNDGFEVTLTVQELLTDKRYYFPHLMDNHPSDGAIPGSPEDAQEVEPVLALRSAEDSNDPAGMNDRDALLLMLGQRVVTEQTNPLFLKYVNKIEVLTTPPQKWDNPKADTDSGEVPAGALIKLSNKRNDMDKIYYTTDGSTPTLDSPVFNMSASRWWPLRDDLDNVNQPVQINEDTVIKAITIGPGKLDSEVVTFTYKADFTGRAAAQAKLPGGPPTGVTLDQDTVNLKIGSSYELAETVGPGNAIDKSVSWSSSDTSVATVDNSGLVTVVGPGTAVITVKTVTGNMTATCVVNGPNQDSSSVSQEAEAQPDPPVAEPEAQAPAETEMATGEPNSANEVQEEPDEPEAPLENWQYLAEKDTLTGSSTTSKASSEQVDSQLVQVFAMPVDAGPAQLQLEQNNLDIYVAGVLIFLFLFGGSRRYMEYTREATM